MSGIIYEHVSTDGDERFHIDLGDDRLLIVNVTSEGIIMDVYGYASNSWENRHLDPAHLGTMGMMFDEWADEIISLDSPTKVVSSNHNG